MKAFYEKLLDFLYDYADWLIMALVIVVIVATIGWRLDVLFERNTADLNPDSELAAGDEDKDKDGKKDDGQDQGDKSSKDDEDDDSQDQDGEIDQEEEAQTGDKENPNNNDDNNQKEPEEEPESPPRDDEPASNDNSQPSGEIITVVIPDGSPSTSIGNILTNNGLVSSSNEFVKRAEDLDLDRRLQSGTFKIPKNASLDDVIKIVAKRM